MSTRERAVSLLEEIESGRPWLRSGSPDRDDRFVDEIVSGVLRWKNLLDHFIATFAERPIDRVDDGVRRILETGLYQLHFMRVPPHAAVSESVTLAGRTAPKGKGFVNALLRRAVREGLDPLIPADDSLDSVALRTGHPVWLVERWSRKFGRERAVAIAESNQQLSMPDLVVNTRRIEVKQFTDELDRRQIGWRSSTLVERMIRLEGGTAVIRDLLEQGLAWPMDEGSAIVAGLAAMPPGSPVLDVAAAPGGKSFLLALEGCRVFSSDASLQRLQVMKRRWAALSDEPIRAFVADGRRLPLEGRFDSVLVDAPCSATGIIRKYPEIKWRLRPEDLPRLARTEEEILASALEIADRVVYATCSLEAEENDEVVKRALSKVSGFEIADAGEFVARNVQQWVDRGVLRLTPDAGTDGFTAFVLVRR